MENLDLQSCSYVLESQNYRNCASYQSLTYLNAEGFQPGQVYHVLKICTHPTREASRMHVKLKLLTDTYILPSKISTFGNTTTNATCLLCKDSEETKEHFLLKCKLLQSIRQPITNVIGQLCQKYYNCSFYMLDVRIRLQLVLDSSLAHLYLTVDITQEVPREFEFHGNRLVGAKDKNTQKVTLKTHNIHDHM